MRAFFLRIAGSSSLAFLLACSASESDGVPVDTGGTGADDGIDTAVPPGDGEVDTALPGTPCEASLTTFCKTHDCPDDVDKTPTAGWCKVAKSGVKRSTTACANWQILQYVDDSGDAQNVYYNSSTGVLSGWTKKTGDAETCVAGIKGFRFPSYADCDWVFGPDLCLTFDAGVDAGKDSGTDVGSDAPAETAVDATADVADGD